MVTVHRLVLLSGQYAHGAEIHQPVDAFHQAHGFQHINCATDHLVINLFRISFQALHVDRSRQVGDLIRPIFSEQCNELGQVGYIALFENDILLDFPHHPGQRTTAAKQVKIDDLIASIDQHPG